MNPRTKILAFLAALALLASACGGTETVDATAPETNTTEQDTTDDTTDDVADETAEAEPVADAINGGKPIIELPGGDAPIELISEDLISTDGELAEPGDLLVMHYVGVLFDDGSEFDSSWDRFQTFNFVLGNGNVIQGWDDGIEGMAVGSRRQLTIPAQFAYGDNSPSPAIPPGSALVFVVDLVAAHSAHEVDTATENETEIELSVITEGDGEEVAAGDRIEVLFTIAEANGDVLQSSWTDGSTAIFGVGGDLLEVFVGWSEPLVGQNVGDEVRIVVPPEFGPAAGQPDAVALVTHITVLDIVS